MLSPSVRPKSVIYNLDLKLAFQNPKSAIQNQTLRHQEAFYRYKITNRKSKIENLFLSSPSILIKKVLWEMDALALFRIPVTSLKADEAEFQWKLGPDFLKIFNEDQDTENGRFEVNMKLQKTSGVITLDFQVEGVVETLCDRCLVKIEMPVSGQYEIIVKFGDTAETTDEVIFIEPEAHELNVASLVYDFILLSIPISRRIPDCENLPDPPCDMTVLSYLSQNNHKDPNSSEVDNDFLWDDLKKVIDN